LSIRWQLKNHRFSYAECGSSAFFWSSHIVLLLSVLGKSTCSCQGFVYLNAAKGAKRTKCAKDSFIDDWRLVRQGNEVRQGLLILARACYQNILGALRSPGELNPTQVAFSEKFLASFVPLAPLAAFKYAQTRQSPTFMASTGMAI
jgi:hypothetical protein